MSANDDNIHTESNTLNTVITNLLDRGVIKPSQVQVWSFVDLYNADPSTLSPDDRRSQIEYKNSSQWAELRKKHGLQ
ncbi:hypothetical protein [Gilvimarinus polysaccharolyticus]|uniref:hypothetical protein n=1 Tax=Gilvimarinus polysaccharolyticus TaxID=863921 RepID=UPI0006736DE9|nr:hypothetical protein [Gilvimarinus polysaccharolyticus]